MTRLLALLVVLVGACSSKPERHDCDVAYDKVQKVLYADEAAAAAQAQFAEKTKPALVEACVSSGSLGLVACLSRAKNRADVFECAQDPEKH